MNIGDSQRFNYTGNIQELTITENGVYKLEVYGAQGGLWSSYPGGNGGYASGYIALQTGTKIYIVVGGQGEAYSNKTPVEGGYNGGGKGIGRRDSTSGSFKFQNYGSGGGGATHIALVTGLLSTLESKQDKLLIVAGGGGGGGGRYRADSGGWNARTKGHPGGETSYLTTTFGQGYDYVETGSGSGGGGGGGGFYGGNKANGYSGGGGSSWTGGVVNATTTNGANGGNGYAVVTMVSKFEVNPVNSGNINISISSDSITLTAIANSGYEFIDWTLDGYTRLEYIESTGTQYIETGLKLQPNSSVELKFTPIGSTSSSWRGIFGSRVSATNTDQYVLWWQQNTMNMYIAYGNVEQQVALPTMTSGSIYTIRSNNGTFYLNDTQIGSVSRARTLSTYDLQLGRIHTGDNSNNYPPAPIRIYYCKIKNDNVLVRDFIPVIRHSDGQIGLLDLINLKFYGNSGTGVFKGGGIV